MTHANSGSKTKILDAADTLARDVGPGHISLEAVAARAGVSKGGLLYHFPTKEKLLEALVEHHLQSFDEALREREAESDGAPDTVTAAFIDLFVREEEREQPPPCGILMALAENPGLLDPIRRSNRMFLDRMKENATDPHIAVIAFLALHGMRNMQMLSMDVLTQDEFALFVERLKSLAGMTARVDRPTT